MLQVRHFAILENWNGDSAQLRNLKQSSRCVCRCWKTARKRGCSASYQGGEHRGARALQIPSYLVVMRTTACAGELTGTSGFFSNAFSRSHYPRTHEGAKNWSCATCHVIAGEMRASRRDDEFNRGLEKRLFSITNIPTLATHRDSI